MPVFQLDEAPIFPPPELAEENGLLAVGGDLSPKRLITAYSMGIFPWYSQGQPLLWWSPDPRLILRPQWLHVPKSLKKTIKKQIFTITFDCAFKSVMHACAQVREMSGTWITPQMEEAYGLLHTMGYAHSVEAWILEGEQTVLAGGVYGLALGDCFFGESMFQIRSDASKVALVFLVNHLKNRGFRLMDCQMTTDHMLRFGAKEISRSQFLLDLKACTPPSLF